MPALIILTSGFPFKPHIPLGVYIFMPAQNKNHVVVFPIKILNLDTKFWHFEKVYHGLRKEYRMKS